ncbi:MAG: hypothetical protein J6B41_06845 [Alistipes sp.]|nr:hypothetical protein [Alistipes sp.]
MKLKVILSALIATLLPALLAAQSKTLYGIAFYDVEALYDTIPSKFYDDSAYTPDGIHKWNSSRYAQKVANISQVIDSLDMPLIALYGVENEQVVKDVTASVKGEYAYIHRTHDSRDGLDFALLYYGDIFFPEEVTTHYNAICIEGYLQDRELAIIINNNSSSLGVLLDTTELTSDSKAIILLGRVSKENIHRWGLLDASAPQEAAGRGSVVRGNKWQMRHRIATNIDSISHCGVYIKEWLLDSRGVPKPTFERTKYRGGYSSSLPIFIYFDKMLEF